MEPKEDLDDLKDEVIEMETKTKEKPKVKIQVDPQVEDDSGHFDVDEADREKITEVTGEILKARRFGLYVTFMHNGQSQIGGLFPGKAYVNASR